jgi:hypothetical protein
LRRKESLAFVALLFRRRKGRLAFSSSSSRSVAETPLPRPLTLQSVAAPCQSLPASRLPRSEHREETQKYSEEGEDPRVFFPPLPIRGFSKGVERQRKREKEPSQNPAGPSFSLVSISFFLLRLFLSLSLVFLSLSLLFLSLSLSSFSAFSSLSLSLSLSPRLLLASAA